VADDIPAEAVEAATSAIMCDKYAGPAAGSRGYAQTLAQIVLAAALPHIRARVLAEVDAALRDDSRWWAWRDANQRGARIGDIADYLRDVLGAGGEREEGT